MGTTLEMVEIARREEGRVATVLREMADEHQPFAGGVMARGLRGAWFNCAQGAGLSGPVEGAEVDGLIAFYEERGIEPRVEVCPFADQTLIDGLAARGFVLRRFEMTFYRSISRVEAIASPYPAPDGVTMAVVDPGDARAAEEFARVSLSGFLPEGVEPTPELLEASKRVVTHPRSIAVRAMVGGRCVGAGAMEMLGDLATLYGVSVVPDMRRRGIQLAMMAWRLREAARRGAVIVTIGSLPGASTESNAMRMGFRVAYTKAVMVRPGAGLTPVEVG
jgi:GNAT superfamily N-acetyltransferase